MANRSRTYRIQAVILRRRDYQDADRILTVFTPGAGKQQYIAKGIRKTTSRKSGHLELFTHVSLLLAQSHTWDIITEAVAVESFRHLRQDLERIGQASYVCELVDRFSEADDENQLLWDLLLLAMRELDQPTGDTGVLLRWFELHLLSLTGFQPEFFRCLGCGSDLQPETNYLSLNAGGVYCPRCGREGSNHEPMAADVLKVLRYLQRQRWHAVRALRVRPNLARQVENVLYRYLLLVLERQIKSVDFLIRLRNVKM